MILILTIIGSAVGFIGGMLYRESLDIKKRNRKQRSSKRSDLNLDGRL